MKKTNDGLEAFDEIVGKIELMSFCCDFAASLEIVRKELKALDVIKRKSVDCGWLKVYVRCGENVDEFNATIVGKEIDNHLTQEEYELLKEVLE